MALLPACPHIIIVCQIYVKHQLALHWRKNPVCCQACTVSSVRSALLRVHWAEHHDHHPFLRSTLSLPPHFSWENLIEVLTSFPCRVL